MTGIPPAIYKDLRAILPNCGPFVPYSALTAVFMDQRIIPWRNYLPHVNNLGGQVDQLIAYLYNQYNVEGENALVLFLHVLSERALPGNSCKQQLNKLAEALEQHLTPSKEVPTFTHDDMMILADLLVKSGRAEPQSRRTLCITISVSIHNLSFLDATDHDFAVQLIYRLKQTQNMRSLSKLCAAIEPDYSHSPAKPTLRAIHQKVKALM